MSLLDRAGRWTFAVLALCLALAAPALAGGGPQNVLIVANRQSLDSLAVANAYRVARDIPERNVCLLDLPTASFRDENVIPRDVFQRSVRQPLLDFLARHPAADQLQFIALCPGLPLRATVGPQDQARSLASILTLLTNNDPGSKVGLPNPYLGTQAAFENRNAAARQLTDFRLTCWLRGYDRSDALALIARSLAADASAPTGTFYFVPSQIMRQYVRNPGEQADFIRKLGFAAQAGEEIKPLASARDVMGYFSGGSYSNLTWDDISSNTYRPGAVVDMLESYGAMYVNFRNFGLTMQTPVAWFVRAGATAVHGTTDEPFAIAFPAAGHADVFYANYLSGSNVAEAYWSAIPTLWWQNAVFGDPLCAPYAKRAKLAIEVGPADAASSGRKVLTRIEPAAGTVIRAVNFFVDDRSVASATSEPAVPNWAAAAFLVHDPDFPDGWHHARVVVTDGSPAAVQSWAKIDVETHATGRELKLKLADGQPKSAVGDKLAFSVDYSAGSAVPPQAIELLAGDLALGTFTDGKLVADTAALGPGRHDLQAVGRDAAGKVLVQSNFLVLDLAEPLHVVDVLPDTPTGTRPILLLRYNDTLPFAQAALTAAVHLVQNGRPVTAHCSLDKRNLVIEPAAPLQAGAPLTVTVAFPQTAARLTDAKVDFTITNDPRLLYGLSPDAYFAMTVEGFPTQQAGQITTTLKRQTKVILGPVDRFSPKRPALWAMAGYEVSATMIIDARARPEGQAAAGVGLGAHYTDMDNNVWTCIEQNQVTVHQVLAGKDTRLAAWPLAPGKTVGSIPMTLKVTGPELTVSVHEQVLGSVMLDVKLPPGLPWINLNTTFATTATNVKVSRP